MQRNFKKYSLLLLLVSGITFFNPVGAQSDSTHQFIDIKTSAICNSCKKTIETALKKVDGVESANLNVQTKVVTVLYDVHKTNPDNIRLAISKSGYDADDVPADKDAYDHLDSCCKKE